MMMAQAQLADYLFWWAWRLHSSAGEMYSDARYYTGLGCARLALAEVGYIASILLHEDVHRDFDPHCQFDDGRPTGCPHKKLQVLGLARFATKFNLPPTFTYAANNSTGPTTKVWTGLGAAKLADGAADGAARRRVQTMLSARGISAMDPLTNPQRVWPSGAQDDPTAANADCDQASGISFATTTFVLGRSQSVATLATPQSCSKAGANTVVAVPL